MRNSISPVIDFHAHVIEPAIFQRTANHNVLTGFGARPMSFPEKGSPMWHMFSKMVDPSAQVADMDAKGIDIGVISTTTVCQSTWWAEPQEAAELERRANDYV